MEGRARMGTFEVVLEVIEVIEVLGSEDEGGGGRRQRVISNHSRKIRRSQRDHRIMLRTINRAQRREARDRVGEGGGEAKKRNKPQKIIIGRQEEKTQTWAGGKYHRKIFKAPKKATSPQTK